LKIFIKMYRKHNIRAWFEKRILFYFKNLIIVVIMVDMRWRIKSVNLGCLMKIQFQFLFDAILQNDRHRHRHNVFSFKSNDPKRHSQTGKLRFKFWRRNAVNPQNPVNANYLKLVRRFLYPTIHCNERLKNSFSHWVNMCFKFNVSRKDKKLKDEGKSVFLTWNFVLYIVGQLYAGFYSAMTGRIFSSLFFVWRKDSNRGSFSPLKILPEIVRFQKKW